MKEPGETLPPAKTFLCFSPEQNLLRTRRQKPPAPTNPPSPFSQQDPTPGPSLSSSRPTTSPTTSACCDCGGTSRRQSGSQKWAWAASTHGRQVHQRAAWVREVHASPTDVWSPPTCILTHTCLAPVPGTPVLVFYRWSSGKPLHPPPAVSHRELEALSLFRGSSHGFVRTVTDGLSPFRLHTSASQAQGCIPTA